MIDGEDAELSEQSRIERTVICGNEYGKIIIYFIVKEILSIIM